MKNLVRNVSILATAVFVMALMVPVSGSAKDVNGKIGMGYFNSEAPVGGRIWASDKLGLDLGVGFDINDQGSENFTDFYVGAGINYVLFDFDRANFMARLGGVFGQLDARPFGIDSDKKWTKVSITVMPVAEIFFGDHFSLSAGHGFELELISYPDEDAFGDLAGESRTNIRTLDGSVTHLGFHFYFN
jgi:hypothetical protein